ncbi:hypothetical protein AAFM79_00035 [Trichormus azollae HNT15244]
MIKLKTGRISFGINQLLYGGGILCYLEQSQTTPTSGDILKKTENKQQEKPEENQIPKRKPGGQPGHRGKTRRGCGGVDRFEILGPQVCAWCGQGELFSELIKMETQQVGELVDMPIEIVEYLKIYVHLQCVWGNTKGRLVTRDSTGTRYI